MKPLYIAVLKIGYEKGIVSREKIDDLLENGKISQEEYIYIVGEEYE